MRAKRPLYLHAALVVRSDRRVRDGAPVLTKDGKTDLDIGDWTVIIVCYNNFQRQGKLASGSTNLPITRAGLQLGCLLATGRRNAEGATTQILPPPQFWSESAATIPLQNARVAFAEPEEA